MGLFTVDENIASIYVDLLQKRLSYDASNRLLYEGYAYPYGVDSSANWIIKKHFWDGTSYKGCSFANRLYDFTLIWDDASSYTYNSV